MFLFLSTNLGTRRYSIIIRSKYMGNTKKWKNESTSLSIGLYTTPTVGTFPIVRPIDTHTKGYLKQCVIVLEKYYVCI